MKYTYFIAFQFIARSKIKNQQANGSGNIYPHLDSPLETPPDFEKLRHGIAETLAKNLGLTTDMINVTIFNYKLLKEIHHD